MHRIQELGGDCTVATWGVVALESSLPRDATSLISEQTSVTHLTSLSKVWVSGSKFIKNSGFGRPCSAPHILHRAKPMCCCPLPHKVKFKNLFRLGCEGMLREASRSKAIQEMTRRSWGPNRSNHMNLWRSSHSGVRVQLGSYKRPLRPSAPSS